MSIKVHVATIGNGSCSLPITCHVIIVITARRCAGGCIALAAWRSVDLGGRERGIKRCGNGRHVVGVAPAVKQHIGT